MPKANKRAGEGSKAKRQLTPTLASPTQEKSAHERYTVEQVIKAVNAARGCISTAAKALKCNRATITEYRKRHPEVEAAIADAHELQLDVAEGALFKAIDQGQAWAICFYLKTQGRGRGYVEKQEHEFSGPDGAPLRIEVVYVSKTNGHG